MKGDPKMTDILGFDDTFSDEDVKKTPSQRDHKNGFTPDQQVIKTVVTQEDIDVFAMEERFPKFRTRVDFVNGCPYQLIEELYRKDPIGKVIPNDDVAGYSWLYEIPTPSYLYGECYDLYGKHGGINAFCNYRDGNVITIQKNGKMYQVGLCNICLEVFNFYESLKKWSLGLIKNPIYKMTAFMQEIKAPIEN